MSEHLFCGWAVLAVVTAAYSTCSDGRSQVEVVRSGENEVNVMSGKVVNDVPIESPEENGAALARECENCFPPPQWHVGDAWEVDYHIRTINPEGYRDPPPRYLDVRKRYEVVAFNEGIATVVAIEQDASIDPRLELKFSPPNHRLIYVSNQEKVASGRPYLRLEHDALGYNNEAWPVFPLQTGTETFLADTIQMVQIFPNYAEVKIVHVGDCFGLYKERTATQRWENGKPWWTTMTISGRFIVEGKTYEKFELEAKVISWEKIGAQPSRTP